MHNDHSEYYRFTGRQRFDKAIHTLEGLVRGVGADGKVTDSEMVALLSWIGDYREFADRHPFNEVIPVLQDAMHDGIFDAEERYDVLWLCERLSTGSVFYNAITSDMQRLHGFIAGIIADKKIDPHELRVLQDWIDGHQHLKSCWPYDEIEALVLDVMRDEIVDAGEHDALMSFFSEFTFRPGHASVSPTAAPQTIRGVCAVCPEIVFADSVFCFTGASNRALRKDMEALAVERGAKITKNVIRGLRYLVIGADGNPCWAYACYGRKVEQAVALRREGLPLVLVHEHDYWDAVA